MTCYPSRSLYLTERSSGHRCLVCRVHSSRDAVGKAALSWSRLSSPTYPDPGGAWHTDSGRVLRNNYTPLPRLHSCFTVPKEEAFPDDFPERKSTGDRFFDEDPGMFIFIVWSDFHTQRRCSLRHLTQRSESLLSRRLRIHILRLMYVNVVAVTMESHFFPVSMTQTTSL